MCLTVDSLRQGAPGRQGEEGEPEKPQHPSDQRHHRHREQSRKIPKNPNNVIHGGYPRRRGGQGDQQQETVRALPGEGALEPGRGGSWALRRRAQGRAGSGGTGPAAGVPGQRRGYRASSGTKTTKIRSRE
ncbi:hypothetical protein NDU88_001118 [Pleurodeles waltl]|uniref:Uncharacterized protein n=1 Tax=Pleurodeles waltl TaxID=8319 RepID=A0AAV7R646_PLEWA|nr:hypothetical protein NDU88_001118 [Pleurodeles waltl]